jgi:hypothetical protein
MICAKLKMPSCQLAKGKIDNLQSDVVKFLGSRFGHSWPLKTVHISMI